MEQSAACRAVPLFLRRRNAEAFVEAINTAAACNVTLFTGVERVAFAAHVQVQVVTCGRVNFHYVAARAGCSDFCVVRMNTFFHGKTSVKAVSLSGPFCRTPHVVLMISYRWYFNYQRRRIIQKFPEPCNEIRCLFVVFWILFCG